MANLDTKGRIFDIQRFSIHDGRGIRTIVFLKGCVLRCKWCCNPESQNMQTETMFFGGKNKTVGRDVTVREVMETLEKDRNYYRRSGGGVTLSGGEILVQPAFSRELLATCKERGFRTAVESTACAEWSVVESVLPYIDEYLMDVKHVDGAKHKAFTGRDNALILENAKKIAESGLTELVVRVPVIPGFNCKREEIAGIARFAASLPGVRRMHLLPYHRLGQDKYAGLGRKYELDGVEPLKQDYVDSLREAALSACGGKLDVQIGG